MKPKGHGSAMSGCVQGVRFRVFGFANDSASKVLTRNVGQERVA